MHVPRTPTDLGHIVANVIKGIEPRDAIERIIAEARGNKLPADDADLGVTVKALPSWRTL